MHDRFRSNGRTPRVDLALRARTRTLVLYLPLHLSIVVSVIIVMYIDAITRTVRVPPVRLDL
jgi:hypothetical protein